MNLSSVWSQWLDILVHNSPCRSKKRKRKSCCKNWSCAKRWETHHTSILINKDTDSSETQFSMNFLRSKCEIIQKSLYNLEVFNISTKIFLSIISAEISRCQRKCWQSNYHPVQSERYLFRDQSILHFTTNQLWMLLIITAELDFPKVL